MQEDYEKKLSDVIGGAKLVTLTDKETGEKKKMTLREAQSMGFPDKIPATGPRPVYKSNDGKWSYDSATSPASISLDKETGAIVIKAPKNITDSEEFRRVFDEDKLKEYSQAYRLNPNYKVTVTEKNEETGKEEEKDLLIPDYIERLNSSVEKYMENLRSIHAYREELINHYGEKAKNLTDSQIMMAGQETAGALYIPSVIFNVGSFGKSGNPFSSLKGLMTEDGLVSKEEFDKVYKMSNIGRDEMAAILATIDGTLKASGWDPKEEYTDDEGNTFKNLNSATEAAKLISFRNYIVSHNPNGTNWEQMGMYIESFIYNAAHQTTRTFANLANIGEAVVTAGNGEFFQNATKDMDEAMDYFNENNALVWDAITNAQIWGTLGGMALGTWGTGKLLGLPAKGIHALNNSRKAARIAEALEKADQIAKGAEITFKSMNIAEKVLNGVDMAISTISGAIKSNFWTEFIFDTMHDAILYDATGFRDMLSAMNKAAETDDKAAIALNYWLGQAGDNAKFWLPMGLARSAVKYAGKTKLGKATNVVLTKYINKAQAAFGTKFQGWQDSMNGNVVKKLQDQLKKAEDAHQTTKANRIKKKIEIENFNQNLRIARKQLGSIKLSWDGIELTEDSAKEWQNAMTHLKAVENGIDVYTGGVDAQMREMFNPIVDPSTGKPGFLYDELAGANKKATDWYFGLVDMSKRFNLDVAPKSLLNQDVIDYWQGSFKKNIYEAFANTATENGKKAEACLETINNNLESLKTKLPQEIINYIDDGIKNKVYQDFYKQLNKFGVDEKILVKSTVDSYESNPIWVENGYMPIAHDVDPGGRWISEDDKIETIIEQEMDKLTFRASEGEHFRDPELVRQVRSRHMAQARVNAELWKGYSGWGSNATNITVISGEETEYAKAVKAGEAAVQAAVARNLGAFKENFNAEIPVIKKHGRSHRTPVDGEVKEAAVSSLSPSETAEYLSMRGTLKTPASKLTDDVKDETSYREWYKKQTHEVKNYIKEQASTTYPVSKDYSVDRAGSKVKKVKIGKDKVNVDYEIADRIQEINESGYKTYSSRSGIKADHTKADFTGHGYIQFDGDMNDIQKAMVKDAAVKANMDIDESYNPARGNTLTIRQTTAVDGTGYKTILKEADEAMFKKFEVPKKYQKNDAWIDWASKKGKSDEIFKWRDEKVEKLYTKHGGHAHYDDESRRTAWDKFFNQLGAKKADSVPVGFEDFRKMADSPDFEAGLQKAYLMGDKSFATSSILHEAARNLEEGKEAFYQGVFVTKLRGELYGIQNLDTDKFVMGVMEACRGLVNDYVEGVLSAEGMTETMKALLRTTNGADSASRYYILKELAKDSNMDQAKALLSDKIEESVKGLNLQHEQVKALKQKASEMLKNVVEAETGSAQQAARVLNQELTDTKELYERVKEINRRINEAEERVGVDYVTYLDDEGRKVYAQVDPAFASLFNYRYRMEKAEASVVARINGKLSKLFRYGTTGVNLTSFGNQLFRDFGNAIFVGGAWQTIRSCADNLVDVFGQNIVDQIKRFQPEEMERIERMAKETGRTIEETAVSRELMRGAAKAPSSTERTLYKTFMEKAYGSDTETKLSNMKTRLQTLVDKWNPEDLLNGKRENYLRNRVFANNLNDAMKEGYTIEQSRVLAEFAMNNATTNFSRQLYHMQAIADSTPYFRAAINGSKSFWRMWCLDPVGITGRMMGGLILPVMYLTGMSLSNEENKAVYMNIPEYQKRDSFVFVFNGEPVSFPMPQELSKIVAPFRQFVEYLEDANKNDFWELMMNDVLGLSPIDLQGFSTIDMDKMIQDPTIFDRIGRGVSRVFSQIAPIPVKSAYMLASGTDPYTGKKLTDTSYVVYNDETGSIEVMDDHQNAFAKWVATLFGNSMSPELAEALISGVVGTTGSNLLGDITKLVQEGPESALASLGKNVTEQISKPFTVNKYNLTDAVWKRAIRELTTEKEALLNSKEMKKYNSQLSQTKDPDERKKLLADRQNLVDAFEQKVGDTVKRLSSEYNGTFDRQKFAAVTALLNFNSDADYQSGSQYSSNISSESFWNGRDAAIHTMERLGITGTGDTSIFGYLTTDKDGNPVVKYTSPVAIMDMENQWKNQDDIHAANIKALLSQNDVYDAHKIVSEQIQKIYNSKKKLTNQDRSNIEAIQINWNAQLLKTVAPYILKMTPEAAINNTEVLNALYPYVEVPGSWEVNNKGKGVSLGDRGNKKKAYYDSWIKAIFSVNDPYKGQY
jgi:hypothetical protein